MIQNGYNWKVHPVSSAHCPLWCWYPRDSHGHCCVVMLHCLFHMLSGDFQLHLLCQCNRLCCGVYKRVRVIGDCFSSRTCVKGDEGSRTLLPEKNGYSLSNALCWLPLILLRTKHPSTGSVCLLSIHWLMSKPWLSQFIETVNLFFFMTSFDIALCPVVKPALNLSLLCPLF